MSKKPARTWSMVFSLGLPLVVVGFSAMAISYATLIDVARVNGLPIPELFPVLIDVGTVACMVAAAEFRLRGISGRWVAYVTFIALSGVSIMANITHALRAADMTLTNGWVAALLATTPPAALLAITHLVMMLIPDEKERLKLAATKERLAAVTPQPAAPVLATENAQVSGVQPMSNAAPSLSSLRKSQGAVLDDDQAQAKAREYLLLHGIKPSGSEVAAWLGVSARTGQRRLEAWFENAEYHTPQLHAVGETA